jgi:hypothetical protein
MINFVTLNNLVPVFVVTVVLYLPSLPLLPSLYLRAPVFVRLGLFALCCVSLG